MKRRRKCLDLLVFQAIICTFARLFIHLKEGHLFYFLSAMENGVRGNEYTLLNTQEICRLLCWMHGSHTFLMGPCREAERRRTLPPVQL